MPRWRDVLTTRIEFLRGQTADQRPRVTVVGLAEAHQNFDGALNRARCA
jgi:hypothetical protein